MFYDEVQDLRDQPGQKWSWVGIKYEYADYYLNSLGEFVQVLKPKVMVYHASYKDEALTPSDVPRHVDIIPYGMAKNY